MGATDAAETGEAPGSSFWKLVLGSVGVVYGDIGTSPLYALREALGAAGRDGLTESEVKGIVSLLIWTLVLIVTFKYVVLILRADNRGEGGTLSLLALAQRALGRRTPLLFALGIAGAALFYGDAAITPAISVLSAVEGLELVEPALAHYVIPATVAILFALFWVQSGGTARVSVLFGPVTLVWFLVMAGLGIRHAGDRPDIFAAFDPALALRFLADPRAGLAAGDGVGVPGGDRRRGALRRHGPFRPRPDPDGLARPGVPGAGAQLPRPGQPGAGPARGRRQPVLPDGPGLGPLAAGAARHLRHRDRQPGGDLGRLLADPASDPARPAASARDPAHLRFPGRPDLHAAGQLDPARRGAGPGFPVRLLERAGQRLRHRRHRHHGHHLAARLRGPAPGLALAAARRRGGHGPAAAGRNRVPGRQPREVRRRRLRAAPDRRRGGAPDGHLGPRHRASPRPRPASAASRWNR